MKRAILNVATSLLLAGTASGQGMSRWQLVRCTAASDAPCLRTLAPLTAAQRALASRIDSAAEPAAWTGTMPGMVLVPSGVTPRASQLIPARILLLIDRGSGISPEGFALTRIAIKAWLASSDSAALHVAVMTLDGAAAVGTLDNFRYQPPAVAAAELDQPAAPSNRVHSPLYSALRAALQANSGSGGPAALLLITPGRNEIGRGKESTGLLGSDSGLQIAASAIAASRSRVWIMALGSDSPTPELRMLAGSVGVLFGTPIDPRAIADRLRAISQEFVGGRRFTFGLAGDGVAGLARTTGVGRIVLHVSPDTLASSGVDWRPPLIAMPALQGVADSAALGTALRDAMIVGLPGGGDRPMIAVLLLTIVGCGWLLLARLGWTEPVIAPREKVPGSPPTFVAPPPPAAEPRRPEDITHQTARHTAMHR